MLGIGQLLVADAVDAQVLIKEYEGKLNEAIGLLPPQQQLVFRLSREENFSHSDIAKQLLEKTKTMLEHAGFREHFNPLTGEGQGAVNFTWGGLVVDMETSLLK